MLIAADSVSAQAIQFPNPVNPNIDSFPDLINQIVRSVLGIAALIFLVTIVWAGWLWLVSRGDTTQIAKAKKMIYWALAGVVVVVGSYGIVTLLLRLLQVSSSG